MYHLLISALLAVLFWIIGLPIAMASSEAATKVQNWPWQGLFGQYDKAQLKRGFMIYKEVCSNCHAMHLIAYRNLINLGLTEEEIKVIAAEKEIQDGPNEQGEMFTRVARLSDRLVSPYPNDQSARVANNGALPPDLSLISKAKAGGPDYIYSLLIGYEDPPANIVLMPGMNYNKAFPSQQIAMPQPLFNDMLPDIYSGNKDSMLSPSLHQMAKDITAFLNWTAEPELDERHTLGIRTIAFLFILTCLLFALKRQIWSSVH